MQEDAELSRKLAKGGKGNVFLLGRDRREQPLALDLQDVGHLGCEHVVGAGARGFLDQPHRRVEISLRRQARAHLHQTCGEGRSLACAHADGLLPAPAGASPRPSSGSSLPAWSSAAESSYPPTWVEPMKICGTVMRPFARATISLRPFGSLLTSISVNSTPLRVNNRLAAWQ